MRSRAAALTRYIPYVTVNVGGLTQFALAFSMEKERDVSLIYNLSRKFSYTLDLDTVLKTTAALARKMLSSEGALVFLVDEGEAELKAVLGTMPFTDMSETRMPETENWVARLRDGNNVIAERVSLEWLPVRPAPDLLYNVAAVPMLVGPDVARYLMCFSPASRVFREALLEVLSTLASQVAVEKARLYTRTLDNKTKVETILSALRDGLLVTDASGVLVQTNPVADRMLDIDSDAIGKPLVTVLEPALSNLNLGSYSLAEATEAVLEGRTIFGEVAFATESPAYAQAQLIPLRDHPGRVVGMVLFLHDISDLKRIDLLKYNFVSNVSHELRTPLTSIGGFVSLLIAGRAGSLSPQQMEYLEIVNEQSEKLTKMIEDLLDLSRLQARRVKTTVMPANVSEVLDSVVQQLSNSAKDKDIELRARVNDGLPPVEADSDRIGQVLTNIIGNAIKFTDPDGLVEATALRNGSCVQVQVSDNGAGIPSTALPHIFDRFFQARSGGGQEPGWLRAGARHLARDSRDARRQDLG